MTGVPRATVAIVGSGPSACYLAQFLSRSQVDFEVTIFDKLPVPFGLLRFGVAPDHIGTRALANQFARLFESDGVRFRGNTEIGIDISLEELRASFDIVVLATGISGDRALGLEGQFSSLIYGSGLVTRWLNGHPDEQEKQIKIGTSLVVIGNGNVALDLVRLSLTDQSKLVSLGVYPAAAASFAPGHLERVHVVGRSAVADAKFDLAMVRELGDLPNVRFKSNLGSGTGAQGSDTALFRGIQKLVENSKPEASREVTFLFDCTPIAISDAQAATSLTVRDNQSSETEQIACETVISAIGFEESPSAQIRLSEVLKPESNLETGYLQPGLYCVGWFKRGPQGAIPSNRQDAKLVCNTIIDRQFNLETEKITP